MANVVCSNEATWQNTTVGCMRSMCELDLNRTLDWQLVRLSALPITGTAVKMRSQYVKLVIASFYSAPHFSDHAILHALS